MIKKVKTEDLKVGMYVMLGQSWLRHSFMKPNFKITSEKQIKKILNDGIKEAKVDTSKSEVIEERDLFRDVLGSRDEDTGRIQEEVPRPDSQTGTKIPLPAEKEFNPIDQISEELHETIKNTSIPPQTKAKAVYNHSLKMMTNVLEDPRAGSIESSKKMVYDIVDHILADDETAECMALITSHDYYTYTHSVNVGMLSVLLAKSLFKGSYDHNMRELGAGFFLHDLGKCDIPNDLINKPGQLTNEEWQLMRNHPQKGNSILVDTDQLTLECGLIVMQHHEREDGSGYPFGLSKDEIHPYARICSIADVYDALTSTRAYKKKMPTFEALRIMKEEMIQFFNREIFNKFVMIFQE
ncbi:MAG: HD-GYP domain-containing protein [Fidelibacterota bacterium]|nr:MAG: HD-GYP domain-containing protein [Candidatus Neomarinimicrobiota bacterium]